MNFKIQSNNKNQATTKVEQAEDDAMDMFADEGDVKRRKIDNKKGNISVKDGAEKNGAEMEIKGETEVVNEGKIVSDSFNWYIIIMCALLPHLC